MTEVVKVSCFPNEGTPEVIAGTPELGDIVRITTATGAVIYERYTPPPISPVMIPSATHGRDLIWDEFLDVGMATDATKTNAILLNMPVVTEYGRKYVEAPGIQFADATNPAARLARLMAAAKAANLIDDAFLATFMQTWVALFPLMVPENE